MHENLVGLDHAELQSRLFFDHLQTLGQIPNFCRHLLIGQLRQLVFPALLGELFGQVSHGADATTAKPQLHVNDHQQCDQGSRDQTMAHRNY